MGKSQVELEAEEAKKKRDMYDAFLAVLCLFLFYGFVAINYFASKGKPPMPSVHKDPSGQVVMIDLHNGRELKPEDADFELVKSQVLKKGDYCTEPAPTPENAEVMNSKEFRGK